MRGSGGSKNNKKKDKLETKFKPFFMQKKNHYACYSGLILELFGVKWLYDKKNLSPKCKN